MKKDVLIFFSFSQHKTGYYNVLFDPLKNAEKQYGLSLYRGALKDSYIEIVNDRLEFTEALTGRSLDSFSAVHFDSWLKAPQQALAAALYLKRKNIPFLNDEIVAVTADTKVGEIARMSDLGIPLPRTFMSSSKSTLSYFKSNAPFPYPFIAKAANTFGGKMNYLVKDFQELKTVLKTHPEQSFILQEYIPNDGDYRVIVMGGKIQLLMKRVRNPKSNSHLNNTSAGATAEFLPLSTLTKSMQESVLLAARATLRSGFAGVDLIIDKETGKYYILEVNDQPAIQVGSSPETKIPIFMGYLRSLANKKEKS